MSNYPDKRLARELRKTRKAIKSAGAEMPNWISDPIIDRRQAVAIIRECAL